MTVRILGSLATALLAAGCAKISAPSMDFAGPTLSVDVKATGRGAAFSHFSGDLTASVSVQHTGPVQPTTSAAAAGAGNGTATYRLRGVPGFSVGDVLTVTWSAPARSLVGTSYTVTERAQYRIVAGTLQVQTPAGGLGPGASGKVCVALLPNSPTDANVILQSSAVALTPTLLHLPAGQSHATTAATATMGNFSCPAQQGAPAAAPLAAGCNASNGVVASATIGGLTIHGCGNTGPSCGDTPAAQVSICPP